MGFGNNYRGHKYTVHCPIDGCNYTSRHWVYPPDVDFKKVNKISNRSYKCPKHRVNLIR